ncbi:MAG: phosphate acyltransferase PlsX [Rickettsiales bacterium]|nr:phosphate acyltransferase PlsX [Rickettsiales bacterium]
MSELAGNSVKNIASNNIVTISLDAMGGDKAPDLVIEGAYIASKTLKNINFKIYGNKKKIMPIMAKFSSLQEICKIIHTEEFITSDEKPSNALRKGKNSSMYMAINAVKAKEADAIVSAGNTGALMALSKFVLQTLPGIDRPAIGGILPTIKGYCIVLDLGANIHCDAENLFEFAVMGNAFARAVLGLARPSIGLLNVGTEKSKGHETLRLASSLIEESEIDLNYYGFVEGNDINAGTVDVIVADGFTGNIALKTAEGTSKFIANTIKQTIKSSPFGMLGALVAAPAIAKIKKKMDPRSYNGAMFLGLNGIVVKSHGGTDEVGFANAIKVAYKLALNNINEQIIKEMVASGHSPEIDEDDEICIL